MRGGSRYIEAFLRQFDRAVLSQLPDHSRRISRCSRGANGGGIDRFAQNMSDAGARIPAFHSVPVARPARFLSFRAAHANARGSFRERDPSLLQNAQDCGAFGNPGDVPFRSSGITRSATRTAFQKLKVLW